ncbi:MAG: hypothetical protein WD749_08965 [Phycisphaerales bacterium]
MNPEAPGTAVGAASLGGARPSRPRSIVAFLVGAGLLVAAGWVVARQGEVLNGAWESIRSAPPLLMVAAMGLPLVNFALVSVSFWLLMRREGRVSLLEMTCLIGAAWLLNFMPMRPGLVGRIAYHRAVNGIPVARSVRVTLVGLAAAGGAALTTLLIAAALGAGASGSAWAAALSAPVLAAGAVTGVLKGAGSPRWVYGATFVLRYLDTLVWALRYWVLFALVGSPIEFGGAVAVGAVAQAAMLIPLVGNGLGIREWAAGLTAGALPAGVFDPRGAPAAVGLAADLVNRAIEIAVAVPVGVASSLWLASRIRSRRPA